MPDDPMSMGIHSKQAVAELLLAAIRGSLTSGLPPTLVPVDLLVSLAVLLLLQPAAEQATRPGTHVATAVVPCCCNHQQRLACRCGAQQ